MTFAFRPAALPAALFALVLTLLLVCLRPALAQTQVWIQIEAQPSLAEATERAQAYATLFPETNGFRLGSGWYAIALGPYEAAEGAAALDALKRENLIPRDSYISDGVGYGAAFWPLAGALPPVVEPATPVEPPEPVTAAPLDPVPEMPAVIEAPPETLAQARASEAALSPDDKKLLQTALKWFGFYDSTIDGAYGPGTRNAMAAWQEALGLDPTGTLTTLERATLVANYEAEVAEFGFALVEEQESGIDITLPLSLVEFDRYEPPFVHFREKNGSGLSIVLISQPGDLGSFYGLYDILQSLEAIPETGERTRTERQFRIHGTSATHDSHAWAGFEGGFIKGWMMLSTPATAARDARIMEVMEQSFRAVGSTALDPGLVPLDDAARRGLVAGLDVKTPEFSRSGFYISNTGAVLTTLSAVQSCGRVTLDRATEAKVTFSDAASGLAVLTPATPLAPPAFAAFQTGPERIGSEIAVAGYSYEDRLPAPVLSWGTLEELSGLNGEAGIKRLGLTALPGDVGGPVVDATGAVIGMLLPAPEDASRQLPAGVAFAASGNAIVTALKTGGVAVTEAAAQGALPPETLQRQATGMTVLVSCWK